MKKISRRSFLVAAGISAALALTACSSTSSSTAASAGSSTADSAASGSVQAIQSLDDLAGKTVGVQLGTTGDLLMSEEVGDGRC